MSYTSLMFKAASIATFITRDIDKFAGYGVTAADVTAFSAKIAAFETSLSDVIYLSTRKLLVESKEAKKLEIYAAIRPILTRTAAKFGKDSGLYTSMSPGELHLIPDDALDNVARNIVNLATTHLTALATKGLTAAMLTELSTLAAEFQVLTGQIVSADSERDIAAKQREADANEVHDLMSEWCEFGKEIWKNVNEAKYNDYVIYDADDVPQTPTDAPTGLQVNMQTLLLTWLAVAGASGYKVKVKYPADSGTYTDAHEGIISTTQFTLASQNGSFKVIVYANSAGGLSVASVELPVNYTVAAPGGYEYDHVAGKFVWVLVAGVSFYRMEASYDGGQTWQEISAQDFTVGEYVWSPPPGMFRLRAEVGNEVSVWQYATVA